MQSLTFITFVREVHFRPKFVRGIWPVVRCTVFKKWTYLSLATCSSLIGINYIIVVAIWKALWMYTHFWTHFMQCTSVRGWSEQVGKLASLVLQVRASLECSMRHVAITASLVWCMDVRSSTHFKYCSSENFRQSAIQGIRQVLGRAAVHGAVTFSWVMVFLVEILVL